MATTYTRATTAVSPRPAGLACLQGRQCIGQWASPVLGSLPACWVLQPNEPSQGNPSPSRAFCLGRGLPPSGPDPWPTVLPAQASVGLRTGSVLPFLVPPAPAGSSGRHRTESGKEGMTGVSELPEGPSAPFSEQEDVSRGQKILPCPPVTVSCFLELGPEPHSQVECPVGPSRALCW